MRVVRLYDGVEVPVIGQGTWGFGADPARRAQEVRTLQAGLDAGLSLIDTAQYYAAGGSERVVGAAIAANRAGAFVVTKVWPRMTTAAAVRDSVHASLRRLDSDYVDAVLIHWPSHGLPAEVWAPPLLKLQASGAVRYLGVSNFSAPWLEAALGALGPERRLAFHQLPYHLADRRVERSLLAHNAQRRVVTMAYSPLGHRGPARLPGRDVVAEVARRRQVSAAQVLLNWVVRSGNVVAIPKASSPAHARDNAAAGDWALSPEEVARLDAACPPSRGEFTPLVPPYAGVFRLAFWLERRAHGRQADGDRP
jgi:diketogulonate reductase-like aldo/keto reductase